MQPWGLPETRPASLAPHPQVCAEPSSGDCSEAEFEDALIEYVPPGRPAQQDSECHRALPLHSPRVEQPESCDRSCQLRHDLALRSPSSGSGSFLALPGGASWRVAALCGSSPVLIGDEFHPEQGDVVACVGNVMLLKRGQQLLLCRYPAYSQMIRVQYFCNRLKSQSDCPQLSFMADWQVPLRQEESFMDSLASFLDCRLAAAARSVMHPGVMYSSSGLQSSSLNLWQDACPQSYCASLTTAANMWKAVVSGFSSGPLLDFVQVNQRLSPSNFELAMSNMCAPANEPTLSGTAQPVPQLAAPELPWRSAAALPWEPVGSVGKVELELEVKEPDEEPTPLATPVANWDDATARWPGLRRCHTVEDDEKSEEEAEEADSEAVEASSLKRLGPAKPEVAAPKVRPHCKRAPKMPETQVRSGSEAEKRARLRPHSLSSSGAELPQVRETSRSRAGRHRTAIAAAQALAVEVESPKREEVKVRARHRAAIREARALWAEPRNELREETCRRRATSDRPKGGKVRTLAA
ncbi:unnamed protein product [Effrenium voratum]|uniref:Uncharacterized protein n=1 Tax=Effrenium voratum TaxID=2562239 RepID=A0AA36JCG3_9DINO|nr:unnamed protein product [Effrenium voratum]